MNNKHSVVVLLLLLFTLVKLAASIIPSGAPYYNIFQQTQPYSSVIIAYNRSTEIKKHCSPFLASASELKPEDYRGDRLKDELSFYLGDWKQEINDGEPLLQLDDEGIPQSKLVSFELKDVNSVQHLQNAVSLGGILSLGISKNSSLAFEMGLNPYMNPCSSVMPIVFEGIYMETKQNGGEVLDFVSREEAFNIVPNYRFNGSSMSLNHGKLGPFLLGKDMELTGALTHDNNIKFIFQHVKCEQDTTFAKISAVLRAFPIEGSQLFEAYRTGLSGLTLTAEGKWDSSSGQLLMVGCEGRVESGLEGCDYQIAVYFPHAFSIKQRSFLFGSIYNLKKGISFDNPLFFDAMNSPVEFLNRHLWHANYYSISYEYSKNIKLVDEFERKTPPYQIFTIVKQLLFQYPALKDRKSPLVQLSRLANSLGLNGFVISDQLTNGQKSRVLFQIQVLSLGPLLVWYDSTMYWQNARNKPVITKEDLNGSRFFNVSMHLMFRTEKSYRKTTWKNVSELSLEGLYDPTSGEVHLIGCRKALVKSIGIERGQDCLIEVKIDYPAKIFQWIKNNPSAKITIRSQRMKDDPLYFSLISLDALLTNYYDYFGTAANQEYIQVILCILMLVGSIAIIWSQLLYMKVYAKIVPHISTFMLACQILGYCLPLICGTKFLLKSKDSEAYKQWPRDHPALGMLRVLERIQNVLLLVALLFTARLIHMVRESRKRPRSEGSPQLRYASRKKYVIHGLIVVTMFQLLSLLAIRDDPDDVHLQSGNDLHMQQNLMTSIENLVYMFQDMFLLPQILVYLSMETPVKSLRKAYYLGFTAIRLLVHFYDDIWDPILRRRNVEGSEFMSQNSNSALLAKDCDFYVYVSVMVGAEDKLEKKKSENSEPSPTLGGKEDSATFFRFGWEAVLIGYGIGTAFGVIMGHIAFTRKPDWFLKTFGKKQRKRPKLGSMRN
ncbi:hypothetical protein COLO4_35012 [Corchorus olitorius]|uniref:RING-type E3 ubiquitin transferase n=1 Tax=Corchorus olitorius TaxID=93759 RepID=A0A1R3GIH6_9ROSI|nr:hypothetical protein COLO4_35012 [Corchorus olitorius]